MKRQPATQCTAPDYIIHPKHPQFQQCKTCLVAGVPSYMTSVHTLPGQTPTE